MIILVTALMIYSFLITFWAGFRHIDVSYWKSMFQAEEEYSNSIDKGWERAMDGWERCADKVLALELENISLKSKLAKLDVPNA